jgi:hypothetical protein
MEKCSPKTTKICSQHEYFLTCPGSSSNYSSSAATLSNSQLRQHCLAFYFFDILTSTMVTNQSGYEWRTNMEERLWYYGTNDS